MIRTEALSVRLLSFSLRNVNLAIGKNEFFVLMGPTGAGKTVILEAIAGLIQVDRGQIFIGGKEVTGLPSEKRGVGIVYQDHALFPHLDVMQNIGYGLRYHAIEKDEGQARLNRLTGLLGIRHLMNRLPIHLSGGERQRVALARALIVQPHVLLLDEPLSAIDPGFREEIRTAIKTLHQNTNTTFLMVTHDFGEALSLADRGAILQQGEIAQTGAIQDLFHRPASMAVAEFVGMKNIFEATFENGIAHVQNLRIQLNAPVDPGHRYLAIRPEDLTVSRNSSASDRINCFNAVVAAVVGQGFAYEIHLECGEITLKTMATKRALVDLELREGAHLFLYFDPTAVHTF